MEKIAPVFYWLPGEPKPTLAGEFQWDGGQGRFAYADSYLSNPDAVPLDPVSLPLKRGKIIEQSFKGIFGVFSDTCADAWGKRILESMHGELDEFDVLEKSLDDGVGAIAIGDLTSKVPDTIFLDEVVEHAISLSESVASGDQPKDIPRELLDALAPTTSIGGMKRVRRRQGWNSKNISNTHFHVIQQIIADMTKKLLPFFNGQLPIILDNKPNH
jgi:serine/threonine-protein kinase HipA